MTHQYCLRWNQHHPNFVCTFSELLLNETLVDVTLAAEGKLLQAHKLILSACSPYFKELFSLSPTSHPIVILKDVSYEHLKVIVDYMYKGEVNISQEQLQSILKTANSLQIKGLCEILPAGKLTLNESETDNEIDYSTSQCLSYENINKSIKKRKMQEDQEEEYITNNIKQENRESPVRSPCSPAHSDKFKNVGQCASQTMEQKPSSLYDKSSDPGPSEELSISDASQCLKAKRGRMLQRQTCVETSHQNSSAEKNGKMLKTLNVTQVAYNLSQHMNSEKNVVPSVPSNSGCFPDKTVSLPEVSRCVIPCVVRSFSESDRYHSCTKPFVIVTEQISLSSEMVPSSTLRDLRFADERPNQNLSSEHCPSKRNGPHLACSYCWNTLDAKGRIVRRKSQYYCKECRRTLCLVPCFQEFHRYVDKNNLVDSSTAVNL